MCGTGATRTAGSERVHDGFWAIGTAVRLIAAIDEVIPPHRLNGVPSPEKGEPDPSGSPPAEGNGTRGADYTLSQRRFSATFPSPVG
jgi:hypothetical protein